MSVVCPGRRVTSSEGSRRGSTSCWIWVPWSATIRLLSDWDGRPWPSASRALVASPLGWKPRRAVADWSWWGSKRQKSQRQLQPELLWRKRVNGTRERRRGDGEGRELEGDVRASVLHRNGDGEAREQETLARLRTIRSEEATREFKAAAAATRVGHSHRPLDYSYECAKASRTSLTLAW